MKEKHARRILHLPALGVPLPAPSATAYIPCAFGLDPGRYHSGHTPREGRLHLLVLCHRPPAAQQPHPELEILPCPAQGSAGWPSQCEWVPPVPPPRLQRGGGTLGTLPSALPHRCCMTASGTAATSARLGTCGYVLAGPCLEGLGPCKLGRGDRGPGDIEGCPSCHRGYRETCWSPGRRTAPAFDPCSCL